MPAPRRTRAAAGDAMRIPSSPAARAFKKLAARADTWPVPAGPRGNIEFFVERLVRRTAPPAGGRAMNAAERIRRASQARAAGDELIMRHAELVKRIAYHLAGRLPPSVEVDDLIQAGMLGLLEAAANYAANRGASFETYAGIRIRGAMIDALRKLDWAPRSVHRKARAVAAAVREIERRTGRDARDVGDRAAHGRHARGVPLHRAGRGELPAREPGR